MPDTKLNIIVTAKDQASGVFKGLGSAITGFIGGIGAGVVMKGFDLIGDAVRGVTSAMGDSITQASNLNETFNKVSTIFGEAQSSIVDFSKSAAGDFGMSQQSALDAASSFGVFGKAAGLTGNDLSGFASNLTGLSADLASFYNTTPEEAALALQSALRGESEPLRRYGVLLDDATLRQKALELGIVSTTKDALTPQQKVLAANAVILEQTSVAQGDFAKTSDGLANQQRILAAQVSDLKAKLGTALLPVVNTLIKTFTTWFSSDQGRAFIDGLVAKIQVLADWLGVNLPIAIAALSAFWVGTLQPAIQTVWAWISSVLIPFLQNVVYPWLAVNIPIALQILSDFWTNTLQPAIAAVWAWMQSTLIPFLQNVVFPWLAVVIPQALQILSDFWNNVLLPAIKAIWKFLTVDMQPVWEALIEFLKVAIPLAITVLVGFWQNVLQPALQAIWDFIQKYILPIFKSWSDSIGGISGAIETVVGWINTLTEKLRNIKLPDWLTPGSPTPFEMGLRGISDALDQLNGKQLPQFAMQLENAGTSGRASTINNFSMNINTNATSSTLTRDYAMMRARIR